MTAEHAGRFEVRSARYVSHWVDEALVGGAGYEHRAAAPVRALRECNVPDPAITHDLSVEDLKKKIVMILFESVLCQTHN